MSIISLPKWVLSHLYKNKTYETLTPGEINNLRERLKPFSSNNPEVSIVIPAWNEQNNLFRTLSSLSATRSARPIEIIVINNNSTDSTQSLIDQLNVRNYLQSEQGTPFARQMGLYKAKGKFHLCADSDTFYPPNWVDTMIEPMISDKRIVGVYGRYSFLPHENESRLFYYFYEKIAGILIRIRKSKREHINFLGLNMGFVTEIAKTHDWIPSR
jgi:glycosyltransferase involved in cell wall biosynthesis